MEKNFYTEENFERLLREQTDRFTMQPTQKVWHSVYNDLHPARKWPSIAISLLLIISIVLLGYLNTGNDGNKQTAAGSTKAPAATAANNRPQPAATAPATNSTAATVTAHNTPDNIATAGPRPSSGNRPQGTAPASRQARVQVPAAQPTAGNSRRRPAAVPQLVAPAADITVADAQATSAATRTAPGNGQNNAALAAVSGTVTPGTEKAAGNESNETASATVTIPSATTASTTAPAAQQNSSKNITAGKTASVPAATSISSDDNLSETGPDKNNVNSIASGSPAEKTKAAAPAKMKGAGPTAEDIAWMDNYAFHNKTNRGRWKNRLSWKLYVTPSVSYRMLFDNTKSGENGSVVPNGPASLVLRDKSIENSVTHKPGPALEAGAALQYAVGKRWHIKSGVQLNYNSYSVYANEIAHPFSTSLVYNNLNTGNLDLESKFTSISNVPDGRSTRMSSYSIQLALPVGFDYKIGGSNAIEWYAGATLQPSFVLGGRNFLLSADRLAYVEQTRNSNSLMRSFNLAFGAETFVSYKKGDYTFMAGPSMRYQLMTTNSNAYTVGERAYNFGLSLGVSKRF